MNILEEAQQTIHGERRTLYGPPKEEFPKIAAMWSQILNMEVTAQQVILCMIAGKLLRLSTTPTHRDSQIDIAGYAGILEEL